ncbi:MAG: leucyl aminopeptidase [Pseudomonadota bacterium]|nr:leucyl aminopeptidase [Pseudomonadota bacterium]
MSLANLFDMPGPLAAATARDARAVSIVLVDSSHTARNAGGSFPTLPSSLRGALGERADLPAHAGQLRCIIVGCGRPADHPSERFFWEAAGAAVVDALRALRIDSAKLAGDLRPYQLDAKAAAGAFAMGVALAAYENTAYRTELPKGHFRVKRIAVSGKLWRDAQATRHLPASINWARALVDAPANVLTPTTFAEQALRLRDCGVTVKVLDMKALERIGAGGLLAVGRGSEHPPCLVICTWKGRSTSGIDLGLVGKGLTFDGGGLNLKQRPVIEKMKFDMGGAAAVVGAMRALAARKAPLNVVAAIPLCENAIDAKAYRPGDVITSLAGLTIEVDNTDAEGRIVVADAMSYLIEQHKPKVLVDVATLTGGIMAALHEEYAGLFTTEDALAQRLEASGNETGEHLWRLPLSPRQDYLVDSDIADVKNVAAPGFLGVGMGSSIGGAKFLQRFAGTTRWAHLDIAGTAWATRPRSGIPRGATGFGVRLLDRFADHLVPTGGNNS